MNQNDSLILNIFSMLFDKQIRLQRFCYKNNKLLEKAMYVSIFALIFFFALYEITNFEILISIGNFITLVIIILFALSHINTVLTSFRKFILYGVFSEIVIMISIDDFISKRIQTNDFISDHILHYILMFICMLITWCFISFITKNDIATLTNLIFSTIMGIVVLLKDMAFELIPSDYGNNQDSYNYLYNQIDKILLDMKIIPILITNLIATSICAIKGYWIKNYNNDTDITMDLIKKEENSEDT